LSPSAFYKPVITLLAAVLAVRGVAAAQGEAPRRTFSWSLGHSRGGVTAEADLLLKPGVLALSGDTVYVFDAGDHALKAFALTGSLLWRSGRAGGGPGEFRNVTDLKLGRDGNLWLADNGQGRISRYSRRGELLGSWPLGSNALRIAPVDNGQLVVMRHGAGFLDVFDSIGQLTRRLPEPQELRDATLLLRDGVLVSGPQGSLRVSLFFSGWLLCGDYASGAMRVVTAPEQRDQPRMVTEQRTVDDRQLTIYSVAPGAGAVTRGMAQDDWFTFVQARGSIDDPWRVIDVFSGPTCKYAGSIRLPRRSSNIAADRGSLAVLVNDPAPAIQVYEVTRSP
jgi:hypothetical protein